jgi:cobalt/nickel transport protein
MDLQKPAAFYTVNNGEKIDLLATLEKTDVMDHQAWSMSQRIKYPGVYHYIMEPVPYWEEAEDLFIIHYTKTIIAAFGEDSGWDQPVGLPTEIVPLLRPYGNYAGNSFTGQVLLNGVPAAQSEVEVEFYNSNKSMRSPSDYHITQVVKTDDNGIFTFSCPLAGWWGFSALNEADYTIKRPDNTEKNVELGAVLWVYFDDFQQADAK